MYDFREIVYSDYFFRELGSKWVSLFSSNICKPDVAFNLLGNKKLKGYFRGNQKV